MKNKYTVTVKHKTLGTFTSVEEEFDNDQFESIKNDLLSMSGYIHFKNEKGQTVIFRASILNESIIIINPISDHE